MNIEERGKKTKVDFWETVVFGWMITGMPDEMNELKKAENARGLLNKLKEEWFDAHDKQLREKMEKLHSMQWGMASEISTPTWIKRDEVLALIGGKENE